VIKVLGKYYFSAYTPKQISFARRRKVSNFLFREEGREVRKRPFGWKN
jgi:hypothetical protein